MTVSDWALLGGLLANAAAMVLGVWLNGRKFQTVLVDVRKIELATNSMKDALVKATKDAALLQGDKEGRADMKAEQALEEDAPAPLAKKKPVSVADDRVASATERIATATEKGSAKKKR